jgi:hypothetical protein
MPRGPKGEKRPADVIGAAIMVGGIATGEIEEDHGKVPGRAKGTETLPLFRSVDAAAPARYPSDGHHVP